MRSVTFLALVASALGGRRGLAGNHDPTGVHLSFGDEEDSMVVTWSTAKSTDADVRYAPSLESSTSANLTLSATGTVREFVDGGSGRTTRYVHAATLRRLWRPASGTLRWATRRWKSGALLVHVAP